MVGVVGSSRSALFGILILASSAKAGAANHALSYLDVADCAAAADAAELDPVGEFSVEAWVKPDFSLATGYYHFVVSKNIGYTGWAVLAFTYSHYPLFQVFNDDFDLDQNAQGPVALPSGVWAHVAAVSGGGEVRLYVNGALANVDTAVKPLSPSENELFVGCSPFGSGTYWKGQLDELRIWSRALSQAEILDRMFDPPSLPDADLIAYWPLDDGTGSSATDASGNGHTLYFAPTGTTEPEWVEVSAEFPVFEAAFEDGGFGDWIVNN